MPTTQQYTSLADLQNCINSPQYQICTLSSGTYTVNSTINIGRYGVTLSGGAADRTATRLVRGPNLTDPLVRVKITNTSGQALTMSQAGATTGVVIQNLTFCGGGNTHPNTGPGTTAAAVSPAGSPCGDQHRPAPSACGYDPICTDLSVEGADSGYYPTNPFANAGPYAVELNNIDLEDAAGHALSLFAMAYPNRWNVPPQKVNDVWIHNSAINYSAVTGILFGVNEVVYTNKYIDSYAQHNPYAFSDDPDFDTLNWPLSML